MVPAGTISGASSGAPATLARLLPDPVHGVYSNTGISFGGRTFDGSADGTPQGRATVESVPGEVGPGGSTSYTFLLHPISCALLTLPGVVVESGYY